GGWHLRQQGIAHYAPWLRPRNRRHFHLRERHFWRHGELSGALRRADTDERRRVRHLRSSTDRPTQLPPHGSIVERKRASERGGDGRPGGRRSLCEVLDVFRMADARTGWTVRRPNGGWFPQSLGIARRQVPQGSARNRPKKPSRAEPC